MTLYPRAASLAALVLLVGPAPQPRADAARAALAGEFQARSESPLDDPGDRPLVDEASRVLSMQATREHARWAEGLLDSRDAIEPDGLSADDWI